ncbi:MAG: patatin-like phospholipase family protein [Bradymonadales bacterium]
MLVARRGQDIAEILRIERDWINERSLKGAHIDWAQERRIDYALRLARLKRIQADDRKDIELERDVAVFRDWLANSMKSAAKDGRWDAYAIAGIDQELKKRLKTLRSEILRKHANLSEVRLDDEIRYKKLVLALGGGGGTGYAHLAAFQAIEELGHSPELIVGTSLGALIGYYRAIKKDYDPAAAFLQLPQWGDVARSIRPFLGGSRHGLPALFNLNLSPFITKLNLLRQAKESPSFDELEIPFACVTTAVKKAAKEAEIFAEQQKASIPRLLSLGLFPWKRTLGAVLKLAQFLSSHPDLIAEHVFGLDERSRQLCAVDAIAFSALVPSLLTYEVPSNHHQSREILDDIVKENGIYRFVDGGLANNVPARVAYDAVEAGRIKSRNSFIMAIDVFAPCAKINAFFMPLQQIANQNVIENLPYADTSNRLRYVLSPVNIAPSLGQLSKLSKHATNEMSDSFARAKYALRPLPPIEQFLD